MVLDKKIALYERDEEGKLIPQERKLVVDEDDAEQMKYKDETVKLVPMTRGEIKKLFSNVGKDATNLDKDLDGEIILKYCKDPVFTEEEIAHLKPALSAAIVNTVFEDSGLDMKRKARKTEKDEETDFAKN